MHCSEVTEHNSLDCATTNDDVSVARTCTSPGLRRNVDQRNALPVRWRARPCERRETRAERVFHTS